jgi:cysteine synthase
MAIVIAAWWLLAPITVADSLFAWPRHWQCVFFSLCDIGNEVIKWKTGGMTADIVEAIGNTPMVRINRLNPNPGVLMLAKLEGANPSGSVKDRAAARMVLEAERQGALLPGMTILEPTSGNTGIALAMIGAARGYKVKLAMPESASEERKRMIRAFGAELVLTPAELGTDGAIAAARKIASEEPLKYFLPDQFSNQANPAAHHDGTAAEILRQAGGNVDALVAALGSGGTLMGISASLRAAGTRIIAAEPFPGHRLQGMKNMEESEVPKIFHRECLGETIYVRDSDAHAMARRLAREEGILAGMSSGAAMLAAVHVASRMDNGTLVVLLPDRGERYLSTGLFP